MTRTDLKLKCSPGMQKMLEAFPHAHQKSNHWWANDDNPRFDFQEQEDGYIKITPWTHHTRSDILTMGNLTERDITPHGYKTVKVISHIDLHTLSWAKRIHWKELEGYGLRDEYKYNGYNSVMIPYYHLDGTQHTKVKVRKALEGKYKHCWDEGSPGEIIPYGLQLLYMAVDAGYCFIGEGETDGWAIWHHGLPYIGLPGATQQKALKGIDFNRIPAFYIISEPDQFQALLEKGESFYKRVHNMLRAEGYTGQIFCINFKEATKVATNTTNGYKDPSELHIALFDAHQEDLFAAIMERIKAQAIPANDYMPDIRTLEQALETRDIPALLRESTTLAQLSKLEYAIYKHRIQETFGKAINLNDLQSIVAEARRNNEAANAYKAEDLNVVYEKTSTGMSYSTQSGDPIWISNFAAEITADIIVDDGAEQKRVYEVSAQLFGRQKVFQVPAKDFTKTDWVDIELGARAQITTGQSMKSHLVNAIKYCSNPDEQYLYAHTGWREIDGCMVYLHVNGCVSQVSQVKSNDKNYLTHENEKHEMALQADLDMADREKSQVSQVSQVPSNICVRLTGPLAYYQLPLEIDNLPVAVQSSLKYLDLASDPIVMPLYASLWRSVLDKVDYGVHLAGQTGWGKTQLVALIQQHFGASMSADQLPGSWESTDNALEMLLFQAKDTVVVVDDFKPKGSKHDQDRLHMKADRIFRQIGNGAARARLNSDLEQRAERRPRSLLISTGEDVPRGESLKGRAVVLSMSERITRGDAARKLTDAQCDARNGLYAQAMAGYLTWLAPQIKTLQVQLPDMVATERETLNVDGHGRAGTNHANMLIGMKLFLRFAQECNAITQEEANMYLKRCKAAFQLIAEDATLENKHDKPSEQWKRLLVAALSTGKDAHLVTVSGDNPGGTSYGWEKRVKAIGDEASNSEETFTPGGVRIGWIDGDDIYLFPTVSYGVVRTMGIRTGDEITTVETTLRKFLVQDNVLASTGLASARKTITVRRRFENIQQDVLHIKKGTLFPNDPYVLLPDSLDSPDLEPSEQASEALSEVSQVDDSKDSESSKKDDLDLTQQGDSQFLADESERKNLYEKLRDYLKGPQVLPEVKWYVPGQDKYPEQGGMIPKAVYAQQMMRLLNSRNPNERQAAMNAILEKVSKPNRRDEAAS